MCIIIAHEITVIIYVLSVNVSHVTCDTCILWLCCKYTNDYIRGSTGCYCPTGKPIVAREYLNIILRNKQEFKSISRLFMHGLLDILLQVLGIVSIIT